MQPQPITPTQQATFDRAKQAWFEAARLAKAALQAYRTPGSGGPGGEVWLALKRADALERKARGNMRRIRTIYENKTGSSIL